MELQPVKHYIGFSADRTETEPGSVYGACALLQLIALNRQASLKEANPFAALIVRWLWSIFFLALSWAIATTVIVETFHGKGTISAKQLFQYYQHYDPHQIWWWKLYGFQFGFSYCYYKMSFYMAIRFLIFMAIQSPLFFVLHCIELLVNAARDERTWRQASSSRGAQYNDTSVTAAFKSAETLILFFTKAAAHWAMGNAVQSDAYCQTWMRIVPMFVLAAVLAFLASFGSLLSSHRWKGPQPVAYGHIQTLADLIDEWSTRMYWGDKGKVPGRVLRHAGTSDQPLKEPSTGALYGGICNDAAVRTL